MPKSYAEKMMERSLFGLIAAQAVYLGTLVLKMSFLACAYGIFFVFVFVMLTGFVWDYCHEKKKKKERKTGPKENRPIYFMIAFFILLLLQLIWNYGVRMPYIKGDITGEIMQSFLTTNKIYSVNPMTGEEFVTGMPFRLKILGLPAIYASLCKVTGLSVPVVCYRLVPAILCILSYLVYASLGEFLFGREGKSKWIFLIMVALIWQFGCYGYYSDSARLFLQGWRGESIRATILLPYCFNCLLRKNHLGVILCILAEVCMVWTLYGMGYTLLMAVVFFLVKKVVEKK